MAAASYTTDLTLLDDCNTDTGYAEPTASGWTYLNAESFEETDLFIQGTTCISATVKVGVGATLFDNGSGITMPTDGAFLVWMYFGAPNSLDSEANGGIRTIIGASVSAFNAWIHGGNDTYIYGGWVNLATNPTVTADYTEGSPGTTYRHFGWCCKANSVPSKGNPYCVDAMRYGRCEARINGGDISNGYATFAGFATQNDSINNRWGLIQEIPGGFLWKGLITLGYSSAVDFRDENTLILVDNTKKVTSGFNKISVEQATSRIDWTNITFQSLGTISRGDFVATANADINFEGCSFTDMGTFEFLSNSTVLATTFRRSNLVTVGGGTFTNCVFDKTNDSSLYPKAVIAGTPTDAASITGATFNSSGTKHGLEIGGTASNITLTDINWNDYAASDGSTGNEAIYVNIASGSMTITISGGNTPSIRTAGCSVTVNSDTTVTFTGMKDNSEVRVYKTSDDSVVGGIEDATEGSPDDRSFAWAAPSGTNVYYVIHNWENGVPVYETIRVNGYIVPGTDTSIGIQQRVDRNAITLESGITNLDWIDVYSDWKNWLLEGNLKYPPAFRTTGGDPLNAFLNSGAYWFLRNDLGWKIKPPEEHITILASGNLAPEDANTDMFIPTIGAYTTQILGLQPITQGFSLQLAEGLQYGSFLEAAWYDVNSPYSDEGTESAPNGNAERPVNDLSVIESIITSKGFKTIRLQSDTTIGTGIDFNHKILKGLSHVFTDVVLETGAVLDNATFIECIVEGVMDGNTSLKDCVVKDITYLNGHIHNCALNGHIILGGGRDAYIANCAQLDINVNPSVDMGGVGQDLVMPDYTGLVTIYNLTGGNKVGIGLDGGAVILDTTTVTDGHIHVSGVGVLQDELGNRIESGTWNNGVTIINTLMDLESIGAAVMAVSVESGITVEEALKVIVAALGGKVSGAATSNIKFRNLGDTKDVIDATVDGDGNRTVVTLDVS